MKLKNLIFYIIPVLVLLIIIVILVNPYWFYDGRITFNRQVIIETSSDYSIPIEINNYEGARIEININSSEELRFTMLDFDNYLKYVNREPHTILFTEDHITRLNRTFEITYKGSLYIVLYNYFGLNDDASVDIKIEIDEFNYTIFLLTIALVVLFFSSLYIFRKQRIKNMNIKIINLIMEKLPNKDDETRIIDFKMYLPNKQKIAKIISAFCNGYLMYKEKSYIVFGVKDKKSFKEDFTVIDRLIPIEKFLEESLKNTKYPRDIESFKIHFINIIKSQFDPVPDSCFSIKTLDLKGFGGILTESIVIVIEFNKFKLLEPVETKDHKVFIRTEGSNRRISDSEIEILKLNIKRRFPRFNRR